MTCPHCGAEMIPGNRFCNKCRKRVFADSPSTAGRPATPPTPSPRRPAAAPGAPHPAPASFARPGVVTLLAVLNILGGLFAVVMSAIMVFSLVASESSVEGTGVAILIFGAYALVGAVQLAMFGAQIYVANMVGIAIVRVMGAVMVGIIMAGRTGAAFAAQLGTMQVNEEIDALKTLGVSPVEYRKRERGDGQEIDDRQVGREHRQKQQQAAEALARRAAGLLGDFDRPAQQPGADLPVPKLAQEPVDQRQIRAGLPQALAQGCGNRIDAGG